MVPDQQQYFIMVYLVCCLFFVTVNDVCNINVYICKYKKNTGELLLDAICCLESLGGLKCGVKSRAEVSFIHSPAEK